MSEAHRTSISPILRQWRRLSALPGGKRIFSLAIGRYARYSGSIGARVLELEPGHALIAMKDRPFVRNHLRSVHALALANLGELTSGLAMLTCLPPSARSIVVGLEIDYVKKARGLITARTRCTPPDGTRDEELVVEAELRDADGDLVATTRARWRVGPRVAPAAPADSQRG